MALILTGVALAIGVVLGLRSGGELSNVTFWQPLLWQGLVGGVATIAFVDLVGITGGLGAFLVIGATAAILAFAVLNVRVGGMVMIVAGVGLNLFVTVINWGRPVSASALVSAGIVQKAELAKVALTGGRSINGGATLGFLGDVIPLPWGQVISIGDVLILIGTALVTSSVLRLRGVSGRMSPFTNPRGSGYSNALDVLGRGPAPRRGPGLHPSRLNGRPTGRGSQPGRHPR
ncbi:MAG: DUF5317 family protein [Microthrixaceae bacterium]